MARRPYLLLLVAACGGGGTTPVEPDSGIDPTAGEVIVETSTVCCGDTILAPGTPVAGIDVVVHDTDGTVEAVTSGADGRATITVHDGATVTAVYRIRDTEATLISVAGVKRGDVLRLGDGAPPITLAATKTMRVDFPPVTGASGYDIASSCSTLYFDGFMDHGEVQHTSICDPGSEDLYLYAYVDGALAYHGFLDDVTFTTAAAATLAAWEPATTVAIDVTGLPADATDLFLDVAAIGNGDALRFDYVSGAPAGDTFAHTFPWAPIGDGATASVYVGTPNGAQGRIDRFEPAATAHTITDPVTMPWVTALDVSFADEQIVYEQDVTEPYDTAIGFVYYTRTDVTEVEWRIYAPPGAAGANTITLPDLPAAFDDLDPRTSVSGNGFVELRDYDTVADFDALREHATWELDALFFEGGRLSQPGGSP